MFTKCNFPIMIKDNLCWSDKHSAMALIFQAFFIFLYFIAKQTCRYSTWRIFIGGTIWRKQCLTLSALIIQFYARFFHFWSPINEPWIDVTKKIDEIWFSVTSLLQNPFFTSKVLALLLQESWMVWKSLNTFLFQNYSQVSF